MTANPILANGVRIPEFGKVTKRHSMRNRDANVLVRVANLFLGLEIVRGQTTDELIISDSKAKLLLSDASASAVAGFLRVCTVVTDAGDHLTTTFAVGNTAVALKVAKPFTLRAAKKPSVDHVLWPLYAAGDKILAVRTTAQTGVDVDFVTLDWIALADGRFWSLDLDLCDGKHAYFHCSGLMDV